MWEDTSCCFHYFELEDCPHLTGKTAQLLSGRRGINPQIFSLKSLAEMHTLILYFLMYSEGGNRFQWCLGKHRFSCAQGGIWYLISPSYCCGQNRGITDCLLWSDVRTLGHHFSWFQGGGLVALSVCACWALEWLHWAGQCWKHYSCTGAITSCHLCSPAPSPALGPHFYTCLPTATLPIWI